jgi:NADH pyrophosphatase NudC (nudix superfamily)
MSTHGDGGKGSGRRNEDVSKVKSNWDLIDWSNKGESKVTEDYDEDDDGEVICTVCGTEMSPTEHGRWLHCDVCGNTRDFDEDDSNYDNNNND